jgi:hypothetical protein
MSDLPEVDIAPAMLGRSIDCVNDSKQEAQFDEKTSPSTNIDNKDIWKIFSNVDPVTGEDLDFVEIREYICEHGPAKGLDKLYDYYLSRFHRLDPWSVYLLTLSHFTLEDLEGCAINRAYRRRLEQKVIKLMKKREKDKSTPFNEFLYKNQNIE